MDVLELARPGDGVHTIGKISLFRPGSTIVTLGIQAAQLFGRWEGLPRIPSPYWKLTHSMLYQGRLSPDYVEAMRAARHYTPEQASELLAHDDWVMSQTDPVGLWVRLSDIIQEHSGVLSRPRFCDFSEPWQRRALERALWWFIGRDYDRRQLGGILVNLLGESDPKSYWRLLDRSKCTTVCSGADGAAWEAVRRQAYLRATGRGDEAWEWITCDDVDHWPSHGGDGWWPRILNSLHLERYAPGHLCLPPWFDVVAEF